MWGLVGCPGGSLCAFVHVAMMCGFMDWGMLFVTCLVQAVGSVMCVACGLGAWGPLPEVPGLLPGVPGRCLAYQVVCVPGRCLEYQVWRARSLPGCRCLVCHVWCMKVCFCCIDACLCAWVCGLMHSGCVHGCLRGCCTNAWFCAWLRA